MSVTSAPSPFAPAAAGRGTRSPLVARRVFTRAPFDVPPAEMPQVADHGGSFVSRPVAVQAGFAPSRMSRPLAHRAYAPRLHRRDRSVYAWFESVGLLLGVVSVCGACLALLLG